MAESQGLDMSTDGEDSGSSESIAVSAILLTNSEAAFTLGRPQFIYLNIFDCAS